MTNIIPDGLISGFVVKAPTPKGGFDVGPANDVERPAIAKYTDVGNSERFVRDHAGQIRYVTSWGRWLTWDSNRWVLDHNVGPEHRGKQTAKLMLEEALEKVRLAKGGDAAGDGSGMVKVKNTPEAKRKREQRNKAKDDAKAAVGWALRTHGSSTIKAMIGLARSAPQISTVHTKLDADPWLLNVANGTLNLRTGELHPHRPEDLITKLAPVTYDPKAKCPAWDKFLDRAMGSNAELISYLQRMVGYALTGTVREHVLGFFFGGGANGKSTFLGIIQEMLGDYAVQAPRGLLFTSKTPQHETQFTTLFGARFAVCPEIDDGAAFDEALVKDLTGGDDITARRMREDHWTFSPTHKLFLAGNHKPRVRGTDEGIWRRIRMIPWTVTIPREDRDPELKEKLRAELPGILAWAVRGCLEWQATGLGDPAAVLEATAGYREQSDPLKEFFDLHCVFDPKACVARAILRTEYKTYCEENGAEPLGAKRFAEALHARGVAGGKARIRDGSKIRDAWRGVRLMTEAERTGVGQ